MRARFAVLVWLAVAACAPTSQLGGNVAYRYSSGGAYGRVGVGKGGTGSLYYSDRGGPLTRLMVMAASIVGAAGAVSDVQTKTYVTDDGQDIIVRRETTATVDPAAAQKAAYLTHLATDPAVSFAERNTYGYSGLTGSFEIASQNLGGDTSGWMAGFGYEMKTTGRIGFEAVAKLGFGRFTLHDRTLSGYDDVTAKAVTTMGDSTYPFVGFNVRFGLVLAPPPTLVMASSIEAFVAPDLNLLAFETDDKDPTQNTPASVWHLGLRITTLAFAYLEGKVSFSSMLEEQRSYGLEVGLAF